LKISNEVTLENKGLDRSIINIFKDSAITGAALKIEKHNEEHGLPARVTVLDFDETESDVDVTSDNTLVFNWDTSELVSDPPDDLGSRTGHYSVQARFTLLNQFIYTDLFNFIIY
jgi:hypothetical protein